MTRGPLFPADVVTTHDVRSRMEDLELDHTDDEGTMSDVGLWDEADRVEYRGLAEIIEEVCSEGHPREDVTLINENHFTAYVREWYADTYGGQYHEQTRDDMVRLTWDDLMGRPPFNRINWERVASDEWSHYQQVTIDGCTYLYMEV